MTEMDLKVKIFKAFASAVFMISFAGLVSCEKYVWSPPEISDDIVISFSEHLLPFCTGCHTSWDSETTYDKLSARVNTEKPELSTILTFHSSIVESNMIEVNDTLTIKASDVIKLWASQGAENN